MTERRITIGDVRASRHCVKGAREWFERHGLDFKDFVRNGIPESTFVGTGCSLAARVVAEKNKREGRNRGAE